ncbi:MAG: AAA family ATPase [Oscillospiraceae bacterium]|nr:AAA family ATPase [Oscillospiraceae bacterium]
MLTVSEAAKLWNITEAQVTRYCRANRVDGAEKVNNVWMIPETAEKPERAKRGTVKFNSSTSVRRPLPIGVSNYIEACTNYYYIDKTMMIKECIDERAKVSLFTRPRRFGKTLTMDMMKTFFEISDEDHSIYFEDKAIWHCGEVYRSYQGSYPVIYISFKDIKCDSWNETFRLITEIIDLEFIRHKELVESENVSIRDRYNRIISGQGDEADYTFSLKYLSQMLHEHYGKKAILIIDEYDTPIQQGYSKGFYDEIVGFMRNLLSGVLKDNEHVLFGFLTGILRVAKESIFSGLNNLKINSILDDKYSQYFGFTYDEVEEMAAYYGVPEKFNEICSWYDGYRFGNTDIFNPWSVINYFGNSCKARPFWENTGSNTIIGEVLEEADEEIYSQLNKLLQGEEVLTIVDTNVIYPELKRNPTSIYSFLLVAGYLKVSLVEVTDSGDFMCNVSLPNREIVYVYKKEIINRLSKDIPQNISVSIQKALFTGDGTMLKRCLRNFMLESVSSFDLTNENAYHMMLLGLCAIMSDKYYISSNRESGEGRFDIQLMPKSETLPGVLMELKAQKNCTADELRKLSKTAFEQIENRKYDTDMRAKGISEIVKFGVAFSGKNVEIIVSA